VERRGSEAAIVLNLNYVNDVLGRDICLSEDGYSQHAKAAIIRTLTDSIGISLTLQRFATIPGALVKANPVQVVNII